ncbi:MAG: rhomboid family intramembrane serine protease [Terriglobia bacterium]
MIPLRDTNPTATRPLVTIALIVVNCLVFFYELSLGPAAREQLVFTLGMVPARVTLFPTHPGIGFADTFLPLFSSMFLHAGWLHLIGNMWFLWIFGDNIEDRLGHFRYLVFYLLAGLGAGLAHTLFNLNSTLPSVGASGAVAGVLGAYLLLFPGARVLTLVPFFFFFIVELPAFLILLYWFVIQLFSGAASILSGGGAGGGVAWWAHIGGFVLGMWLIKLLGGKRPRRGFYHYRF